MFQFWSFVLALLSATAQAYIPRTRAILDRVTDNAGSGWYFIEQEIQFQSGSEPLSFKETWVIENENNMKVTVSGRDQTKFTIVYGQGLKKWISPQGSQQKTWSVESPEKYWHFRNKDNLISALIASQILPHHVAQRKPPPRILSDVKWTLEPFVRLTRTGGTTSWAFGEPTPVDTSSPSPGFWVEQDLFTIRKIRFRDGSEVSADNYGSYSRGLQLPKTRIFHWGNFTAQAQLLNATALNPAAVKGMQPSGVLTFSSLPESLRSQTEEFYSRMR